MDIHRCRFVQYPPQPINSLAFSHKSDPKKKAPSDLRLALGRNNGDIEIWNPQNGLWVQETSLKGSKNTTVEQLVWTQDLIEGEEETTNGSKFTTGPLRLFSTGGSTSVTEWDICTGAPKRRAEGNFGDIWCFSAQPQIENTKALGTLLPGAGSQLLAAGCSDGTIILFSTEDDDLRYVRALAQPPVKKPKVLSLTWRDRNTLVAGYEDSMIRLIDVPTRRIIRNMSLGKPIDGNHSVVWTVKCLPNGTILSGDSSGELKIWDAKNNSLVQRLNSHKADILEIATSASGDTIFSVGVDRRTVTYKLVPIHSGTQKTRWAEVSHKRYHQHDVKTAASFESKDLSVLVSGGMDAQPIVSPIRRSQTEYHRALPHLPQQSQISASKASRFFISWWGREIAVYHVRKYHDMVEDGPDSEASAEPHYDTLTRLVMQDDENIQDAQISENGLFVVAATISSVKLFQLRKTHVSGKPCLRTRPIELPTSVARLGARKVGFSPDGKWLYCVRKDNALALTKIAPPEDPKERPAIHEKIVKLCRQPRRTGVSALGSYQQTITQIAFSSDSRVLAAGDLSGAIDIWVLEGHEDVHFIDDIALDRSSDSSSSSSSSTTSSDDEDDSSSPIIHGQKWIRNPSGSSLPQLDSSILALTFRPSLRPSSRQSSTHTNLGLHATRHNPHPVTHELPSEGTIKLFAVTATHQFAEFDVLTSKLSDWSRRNPSRYLPHDFTRIKDRVAGCFWDCTDPTGKGERLWLYGSTWVFMLDVSRDLPQDGGKANGLPNNIGEVEKIGQLGRYDVLEPLVNGESSPAKRQKLLKQAVNEQEQANVSNKRRKRNTGAGDEIRVHDRGSGVGSEVRKFKSAAGEDAEMVDIDTRTEANTYDTEVDDVEIEDETGKEDVLASMRRGETANATSEEAAKIDTQQTTKPHRVWPHWSTFEYHSILGISVIGPSLYAVGPPADASLGDASGEHAYEKTHHPSGSASGNIEVVIVERPMHEVGQAPRFDGGQEWEV